MKKKILIFLCATFSFMLLTSQVKATDSVIVAKQIQSFVYTFDNLETEVKYVRDLKDINGDISFSLYEIMDKGYATVVKTTGNIVDIYYGKMPSEDKIYYVGPNSFVETILTQNKTRSTLDTETQIIKDETQRILNEEKIVFNTESQVATRAAQKTKPSVISGGTEIGIADSRMSLFKYNYWVNPSQLCGAYVAAAMLTYMDKYVSSNFIKETTPISSNYDYAMYILGRTKKYITGATTSFAVISCMNKIMYADYPTSGHSGYSTATESTYKSKIKALRPVIFFLPSWKSTPYGTGHFVLGYKYVDYNGLLWFKAYDNVVGSDNCAWINRNWIENAIYVN